MAPGVTHRSSTLALRIQFHGRDALKVLDTSQDSIQSLLPLIRTALTSLRLPHPKATNVIKPHDAASIIDMYWDVVTVKGHQQLLQSVINRCREMETSALKENSIGVLMVFDLPEDMREIPSWNSPIVVRRCSFDDSTTARASSSRQASAELETGLRAIFESIGLSIPTPVENLAAYIPALSVYIQKLRSVAASEAAARATAEAALAEERARHARILQDIQKECQEPFIVPALLDAFLSVSHIVETVSNPEAN